MEGPNKFCEKKDRSCDQGKEVKIKDSEIYRRPVLVGFFWSGTWEGWLVEEVCEVEVDGEMVGDGCFGRLVGFGSFP